MSHFAKVVNGIVVNVIVAEPEFFETFMDSTPGEWIQTSYNTRGNVHYAPNSHTPDGGVALRGNFAGKGDIYDTQNDVFYSPRPLDVDKKPCDSWTLSTTTWTWEPPTPMPEGAMYHWSEARQSWE